MNLIKPKKLNKGDKIAIIALSSVIRSKENVLRAKKYFEDKGYKVELSKNVFSKNRYLAGTDEEKIEELHRFFKDTEIKMILAARGGYGTIRLLEKIDWDLIKKNPKIFAGYSDLTAIEAMLYKKCGLISFYAPHSQSDFGCGSRSESELACSTQAKQDELNDGEVRVSEQSDRNSTGACEDISKVTEKSFFKTLTNTGDLEILPDSRKAKVYYEGEAKGVFWGGNLATIVSMCGLDFIPDEKFIFFAEDLNENVYKIDKMFTQLLNIEKFRKNLQGVVLGDFLDVGNKKHLDELFYELGGKCRVPILSGFKITHAREKITVPYGANSKFSTKDKKLIIESYLA